MGELLQTLGEGGMGFGELHDFNKAMLMKVGGGTHYTVGSPMGPSPKVKV